MDEGIFMSKQGQLVYRIVSDFLNAKVSRKEAVEILEVRERTISRSRGYDGKGRQSKTLENAGVSLPPSLKSRARL